MSKLGERIKELLKENNLSQTDLTAKIKVSKAQMNRYINHGVQPPADVLQKMSNALGTTVDFLVNGATEEKAKATLKDAELLQQFKEVEQLNEIDKSCIKTLIEAFLMRKQLKQMVR